MHNTPIPPTLLLSLLPGVGAGRYWDWVEHFGSAKQTLDSPIETLPLCPAKAKGLLIDYQQHQHNSELANQAQTIIEQLANQQADLISIEEPHYPRLLKQIHRAPPVLYTKGNSALLHHPQIAIVGTRNPTHGGSENAKAFSRYLASNGFTITSGLALGIDGIAHQSAATQMGGTIAVMATGVDDIYPKRHRPLAQTILENNGLLVTEFAPNTPPLAARFPQRNRIISGLSMGTLIIEAAIKSGSLITAVYANEQNREVFCIPSSIHNPQGKGCHKLIKEGAHLVETADDIVQHCQGALAEWQGQQSGDLSQQDKTIASSNHLSNHLNDNLSDNEKHLLALLGYEPQSLESITLNSTLATEDISASLVMLELKGIVKQSIWGYERA